MFQLGPCWAEAKGFFLCPTLFCSRLLFFYVAALERLSSSEGKQRSLEKFQSALMSGVTAGTREGERQKHRGWEKEVRAKDSKWTFLSFLHFLSLSFMLFFACPSSDIQI